MLTFKSYKMKTKIFTFLMVAMGLLASISVFAQPANPVAPSTITTAVDGSTVTYSVTELTGATYHWILSGGSTTNDLPSQPDGALGDNSVSITWDGATPGTTYNLDVYVVDATGCYSEMMRTEITIESATIDLVASQTASTCSWLTTSDIEGNSAALDQIVFNFETNGGISPIDITYTITCAALSVSETVTVPDVVLTSNEGQLSVDMTDTFTNTSGSVEDFIIEIISAVDEKGNDMVTPGNVTATIEVHSVPVISFN